MQLWDSKIDTDKYLKSSLKESILSIIIVVNNDEDVVQDKLTEVSNLIKRLQVSYEVVVVDNGSTDSTSTKIRQIYTDFPHIRTIVLSRKYDEQVAITAGLDSCVGDYACILNIYTDPPEIIVTLLSKLTEVNDIVIGKHTRRLHKIDSTSEIFMQVVNSISKHDLLPNYNYCVGLNRRAINSITRIRRKHRNFAYLASHIGLKQAEIKFSPLQDLRHKIPKHNLYTFLLQTSDDIISNSFRPIRFVSTLGMLGSLSFIIYILTITALDFFYGTDYAPKGWISLGTIIASLFLLLFTLLTLISEYLIRSLTETRDEPFYFVSEEHDKSIILPQKDKLNVV